MKEHNHKLGRGFSDLLEENKTEFKDNEEVMEIEITKIQPNPDQPRTIFDKKSLLELSESIKEHGVFQPIIVKPVQNGYILVAGERRVKASKMAGLLTIPSIVRDYNSIYLSELAILENLQREDLTPIEEAIAFQKAVINLDLTHEELGKKIGKSRAYITNIIGLLNLPALVMNDVNLGVISMGHARALSKLKDQELCLRLHERIVNEKLSVRDIEGIIRSLNNNNDSYMIPSEKLTFVQGNLKDKISKDIKYKLKKNSLVFTFENEKELDTLIKYILGGKDE